VIGLVEACRHAELLNFGARGRQDELLELIERNQQVIAACGRRSGKTRCAAAGALWNLLLMPEIDALIGPGEIRYAASIANSREQAQIFVHHARALVMASPVLRSELVEDKQFELVFTRNRRLIALPCRDRAVRGLALSFLCLDELAHFVDEGGSSVASAVYTALMPSLAQFGEYGRAVAISTPMGASANFFAELFLKAKGGELPGAASFHATTLQMNPAVDAAFLEAQRVALGEAEYLREFEAEFGSSGMNFFDVDQIREVAAERRELMPEDGRAWIVAIDPSFSQDPFGLVVIGRDARPGHEGSLVVSECRRWTPKAMRKRGPGRVFRQTREERDWVVDTVLDQVAALAERYDARVISDQHMGQLITDELRKRGVPHVRTEAWTATSKTEAYKGLRARIATRRIELPADSQLLVELGRVRSQYRAGSAAVVIPRTGDSHGDLGEALALGVAALDQYGSGGDVAGALRRQLDHARDEEMVWALSRGAFTRTY
jgi:hypothetical protein